MSLKQKAVKGVAWSAIDSWGCQATQFLTFLILARLLSPETFGLISLSNIFIHFIQALIGSGFSDAIVQRKDLKPEHLDTVFWINFGISALLTLIGISTAGFVARFFQQPDLAPVIQWLSLNVLINSFASVQDALLRRQLAFKTLAIRHLVALVIGGIVGVVMAYLGFGVWSLVAQTLVGTLFGVLILWHMSDWRPGYAVSRTHFQEIFNFGINVVGIGILVFLNRRGDDFFIGYFLGPVALGYYTVAYKLLLIVTQVTGDTFQKVTLPLFSKFQEDPDKLKQSFYTSSELLGFIALPLFFGMAILAPELVYSVFGEQWAPSIPVMQVLAFVGMFQTVLFFIGTIMTAVGKPAWNLGVMGFATAIKFPAFMVTAQWGIVPVAVAILVTNLLVMPVRLWFLRKLIPIRWFEYGRQYLVPIAAALAMVVGIAGVRSVLASWMPVQGVLAVGIVVGSLTYLMVVWLIAPRLLREIMGLVSLTVSDRPQKHKT